MGKRGKSGRGRGGGGGGGRRNNWGPRSAHSEVEKHNESFEAYYNALGLVDDGEQEAFWAALRKELPSSFRFTGSRGHALSVQQRLIDHYVPQITSVQWDGQYVDPPTAVEWFPEKLAWSMTTPKQVVRKFPPFASFQKFLVSETNVGNISRQEIVSMIPPLLMDLSPGMAVLDMCAAPGSKSAQLIELIHGGEEARTRKVLRELAEKEGREISPDGFEVEAEKEQAEHESDWSDDGRSTGLLIANDSDYRRAQMLVHQVKRLNSPNLIVTNHDAILFPSIRIASEPGKPHKYLKFDRILADVPCSGDGTCRKNVNIWKDWIPGNGLGLHLTQARILVRALQMLKVGGRVVYSTCSLNPVENEAVVAHAIDRCGGVSKVKIIDCSDALPGLKRKSGLTKWKIMDKKGRVWDSYDAVERKRESDEEGLEKLLKGMFPPPSVSDDRLPLERCLRIYPHLQDTGGFFIAVLEKQTEIKARPEGPSPNKTKSAAVGPAKENGVQGKPQIVEDKLEPDGYTSTPAPSNSAELKTEPVAPDTVEVKLEAIRSDPVQVDSEPAEGKSEQFNSATKRSLEQDDGSSDTLNGEAPPPKKIKEESAPGASAPTLTSDPSLKRKSNQPFEEPFKYLDPTHPELERVYAFYELSPRFPRDRFMVRNATGEPVKAIYYTSPLVRDILVLNEGKGIKFVHCGVKMFMKQDAQGQDTCRWRIQSEGMPIVEAWVGEGRVVRVFKRETLRKLLIEMFPRVGSGGWKELGEIGERVRDIAMGCCVLRVETSNTADGFKERLVMPLWRSLSSLNLMLPKEERKAMLLRLFNDDSELIDSSQARRDAHRKIEEEPAKVQEEPAKVEKEPARVEESAKVEEEPAKVEEEPAKVEEGPVKAGAVIDNSLGSVNIKVDV